MSVKSIEIFFETISLSITVPPKKFNVSIVAIIELYFWNAILIKLLPSPQSNSSTTSFEISINLSVAIWTSDFKLTLVLEETTKSVVKTSSATKMLWSKLLLMNVFLSMSLLLLDKTPSILDWLFSITALNSSTL